MKIFLHIGVSKTGSTSPQRWLPQVTGFQDHGIFIPQPGFLPCSAGGNHIGMALYSGSKWIWGTNQLKRLAADYPGGLHETDEERYRKEYERSLESLVASARESSCSSVLISNEHLSERLKVEDVERITHRLETLFEKRVIVIYLRRQPVAFQSLYGTALKGGCKLAFDEFVEMRLRSSVFNYCRLIGAWKNCGWEVTPRIYYEKHSRPKGWNLFDDFLDCFGIPRCSRPIGQTGKRRQNVSLPPESYPYQLLANRVGLNSKFPVVQSYALALLGKLPVPQKLTFRRRHADVFERIISHFGEGNRKVAREFFGREQLFPQ
jgi:hypothetical protein